MHIRALYKNTNIHKHFIKKRYDIQKLFIVLQSWHMRDEGQDTFGNVSYCVQNAMTQVAPSISEQQCYVSVPYIQMHNRHRNSGCSN